MSGLSEIKAGEYCTVHRDILVDDGKLAFQKDETVWVEKVDPNQQRPEYRYVTLSKTLNQRFQLSDSDITPLPRELPKPEARAGSPRKHRLLIGLGIVVLVLAVSFTLVYFLVFRQNKVVPNAMGLTKNLATQKIEDAGFKVSYRYPYTHPDGKEKVIEQKPVAGYKDKKVKVVDILLTDREMESALTQAKGAVAQANAALQEVQSMGIDTSDLGQAMVTAQVRLDNADCVEDCVGQTDSSAHWAGVVINACQAKKQVKLAQIDREERIASCKAAINYALASSPYVQASIGHVNERGSRLTLTRFNMNNDGTNAEGDLLYLTPSGQGDSDGLGFEATRKGAGWTVKLMFPDWVDTYQWNP